MTYLVVNTDKENSTTQSLAMHLGAYSSACVQLEDIQDLRPWRSHVGVALQLLVLAEADTDGLPLRDRAVGQDRNLLFHTYERNMCALLPVVEVAHRRHPRSPTVGRSRKARWIVEHCFGDPTVDNPYGYCHKINAPIKPEARARVNERLRGSQASRSVVVPNKLWLQEIRNGTRSLSFLPSALTCAFLG